MNTTNSTVHHPVWDVYDLLRTSRLNSEYYSIKIKYYKILNLIFELVLAATTSTAFAGLWLWENSIGSLFWKLLLCVSTLIAIAKPIINFPEYIRHFQGLITDYNRLHCDLLKITCNIKQNKSFTAKLRKDFNKALDNYKEISAGTDIVNSKSNKLLKKCFEIVKSEFPVDYFFIPEGD